MTATLTACAPADCAMILSKVSAQSFEEDEDLIKAQNCLNFSQAFREAVTNEMLRSEKASNSEEDTSPNLGGKDLRPFLGDDTSEFEKEEDKIAEAPSADLGILKDQGL